MWLRGVLLGARWTPGKQWIGKHRRVVKMTSTRRANAAQRLRGAESVLSATAQPYLSQEEETGCGRSRWAGQDGPPLARTRRRWMKRDSSTFSDSTGKMT